MLILQEKGRRLRRRQLQSDRAGQTLGIAPLYERRELRLYWPSTSGHSPGQAGSPNRRSGRGACTKLLHPAHGPRSDALKASPLFPYGTVTVLVLSRVPGSAPQSADALPRRSTCWCHFPHGWHTWPLYCCGRSLGTSSCTGVCKRADRQMRETWAGSSRSGTESVVMAQVGRCVLLFSLALIATAVGCGRGAEAPTYADTRAMANALECDSTYSAVDRDGVGSVDRGQCTFEGETVDMTVYRKNWSGIAGCGRAQQREGRSVVYAAGPEWTVSAEREVTVKLVVESLGGKVQTADCGALWEDEGSSWRWGRVALVAVVVVGLGFTLWYAARHRSAKPL